MTTGHMAGGSAWRALVATGTLLAVAGTAHALLNLRYLRRPEPAGPVPERVSVLIPARDEASRISATLRSAIAQQDAPDLEILVLDDGSSDGTADVAAAAADGDPRLRIDREPDTAPPPGWLGKPWACQRLASRATGGLLVFLDADVVLAPTAIAAAAAQLRADQADLGSPWPRQDAVGALARLVQPLQQWSWVTTLPLRAAARSRRASLAAANGQFLIIDRRSYWAIGGHAAVRDKVLEDIELARAMKSAGRRAALWDGSDLATCRMYNDAGELRAGYRKSLWAAFGPADAPQAVRAAAAAVALGGLALSAVVPPVAAVIGPDRPTRALGLIGYAAAVAGRAAVASRTGSPVWPDSAAHPASIVALAVLAADSQVARARGRTTWKGRSV